MYLTGFADEAADRLAGQIEATKQLGWQWIESRKIDGTMIHDLDDAAFDQAWLQLQEAGVGINCFGSGIANWACSINDDYDKTIAIVDRCIPRMQRLGTKLIRVMSYRVEHGAPSYSDADQNASERFRRVADFTKRFLDAGIQPVHENCMNYGGMSPQHTVRLLENAPGLKLVFDTGNPVFTRNYLIADDGPRQSAWDFYRQVREHIAYIHIKDGIWNPDAKKCTFTHAGDGQGEVKRIVADLLANGYDGGISMEPHLQVVFHEEASDDDKSAARLASYVEYGQRFEALLDSVRTTA